jgi:predicted DNA-binding transcriptional regulator AlpA
MTDSDTDNSYEGPDRGALETVKELVLEELLDDRRLAERLGISVGLLASWRRTGDGPIFIQVAKTSVRYLASDVQKWIEERRLTKHGQPAPKK